MKFNKKVLAAAILGAITVSGAATAAPLNVVEKIYAKEIKASTAAPVALTGTVAEWEIGYNFTNVEVKYVRAELTGPATWTGTTTSTVAGADGNVFIAGAVNGATTKVVTFSIAPNAAIPAGEVTEDTLIRLTGLEITGTDAPVSLTVSLYDQASQAQAGGATGRIASASYDTTQVLSFADSFKLQTTAHENVADVAADPSFTEFVVGANATLTTATEATALAVVVVDPDGVAGPQTAPLTAAGAPITLADVIATPANARWQIAGDVSFTDNQAAAPTDPFLPAATLNGANVTAANVTATGLRWVYTAGGVAGDFEVTVDGDTKIPEAAYTASLITPANSLGAAYNAPVIAAIPAGTIIRNGAELRAPFVQVPPGYQSRLVLNNYSNQDVDYEISVLGEDGNTITTDSSKLTGVVKANAVFVVDELNTVLTGFTGLRRGAVAVSLGATDANVEGLYQILNRETGAVTNYTLVRPGQD